MMDHNKRIFTEIKWIIINHEYCLYVKVFYSEKNL